MRVRELWINQLKVQIFLFPNLLSHKKKKLGHPIFQNSQIVEKMKRKSKSKKKEKRNKVIVIAQFVSRV